MASDNKIKKAYHCISCGEPYRKQDFALCPFCGGDGGGVLTKSWKPNKYQRKAYSKKMKEN